ncbi:Phospholipase A2-alpha [Nymphaea thermarum]|nr:Phospholipase A2-alpha [Nymphaea thermarum]
MKPWRSGLLILAIASPLVVSCLLNSVEGLNIGLQNTALHVSSLSNTGCSRTCESAFCSVPPFLRYGKYCGLLYTGCPGEPPCDGLDACCQKHDACVQAKQSYLDSECNKALLRCLKRFRKSRRKTFKGNTCSVTEVTDIIYTVIEAALIAGGIIHHQ